jgi:hypothetical protein
VDNFDVATAFETAAEQVAGRDALGTKDLPVQRS